MRGIQEYEQGLITLIYAPEHSPKVRVDGVIYKEWDESDFWDKALNQPEYAKTLEDAIGMMVATTGGKDVIEVDGGGHGLYRFGEMESSMCYAMLSKDAAKRLAGSKTLTVKVRKHAKALLRKTIQQSYALS